MKILRPSWPNKTSFPQTKQRCYIFSQSGAWLHLYFKWTNYFGHMFQSSVQFLASCMSLLFYFYERASNSVCLHRLGFHLPSVNWFLSFPIPNECLIVYMASFALCLCVWVHAHRACCGESSRRDWPSSHWLWKSVFRPESVSSHPVSASSGMHSKHSSHWAASRAHGSASPWKLSFPW